MRRWISSGYETPLASHSLGYMLIRVNPGIVLISLTRSSRSPRRKKSTRAMPSQVNALNVRMASYPGWHQNGVALRVNPARLGALDVVRNGSTGLYAVWEDGRNGT